MAMAPTVLHYASQSLPHVVLVQESCSLSLSHGVRRPNDDHRISTSSPINTELRESLVNAAVSIGHITPNESNCLLDSGGNTYTHTHTHTNTQTHQSILSLWHRMVTVVGSLVPLSPCHFSLLAPTSPVAVWGPFGCIDPLVPFARRATSDGLTLPASNRSHAA